MVKILRKKPRLHSKLWPLKTQETHHLPAVTVTPLTPHTLNADIIIICMITVFSDVSTLLYPELGTCTPSVYIQRPTVCRLLLCNQQLLCAVFQLHSHTSRFSQWTDAGRFLNWCNCCQKKVLLVFTFVLFYMKQVHTWGEGTFKGHSLLLWGNWCIDP